MNPAIIEKRNEIIRAQEFGPGGILFPVLGMCCYYGTSERVHKSCTCSQCVCPCHTAKLFTAEDGKEYLLDEWYPLPFVMRMPGSLMRYSSIPDTKAGHRLVRKFTDGSVLPWSMFTTYNVRLREKDNPATHWMVRSWSDYTI